MDGKKLTPKHIYRYVINKLCANGYGKVRGLYNELGLDAYCVSVGDDDYIDRIIKLMEILIRNNSDYWKIIDQDYVMMNNQYNNYIKRVVDIIYS